MSQKNLFRDCLDKKELYGLLIDVLRGSLACFKMTLIAVLRLVCGRFCVLICGRVYYVQKSV